MAERWARWGAEAIRAAAGMASRDPARRVASLYAAIGERNFFPEDSRYLNLGFWADGPRTLDDACRDMASMVAEVADMGPDDVVLDVGPGFGDQDALWAETTGAAIVGVNVAYGQIVVARDVAPDVKSACGSATALPWRDSAFTKVVALESAFHFDSRLDFFAEAYRVLRPGGRLVCADVTLRSSDRASRLLRRFVRGIGVLDPFLSVFPAANWYARDGFARRLVGVGFEDVVVRSIRDDVYPPMVAYLRARVTDAETRASVNPLMRMVARPRVAGPLTERLDYVLAVATKPPDA